MFEFHVTVPRESNLEEFKRHCAEHKIKYAVLALSNGERDIMTSVQSEYLYTFLDLENLFPDHVRTKIEVKPSDRYKALYYEAHFDGFVPGLPWAVNTVKKTPLISSTYRRNMRLVDFTDLVKSIADTCNLPHPEIEQIIYDNNESWDDEWIYCPVL